jgi:heme-degrading monooxygenase HmoA
MIIRLWRGRTPLAKADAYEAFMIKRAGPDYSSVSGLLAFFFTRRDLPEWAEFLLITHWDSVDAIRQFAGDDYAKAKYYPEDQEFLLDFPDEVEHFEVFDTRTIEG